MGKLLKPGGVADALRARLAIGGVDAGALPSAAALDELRLVANVGAGKSADDLYQRRPALFTHPDLRARPGASAAPAYAASASPHSVRVERPVIGEDLYVTVSEFEAYTGVVVDFWSELGAALPERHR